MKNIKPTFSLVSTFAILAAATGLAHSAQASNSYEFTGFQGVCSMATAPLYDESVNTNPVGSEAACGEIAAGLEGAAYFSYYAASQHCTIYTEDACETKTATSTAYKLNKLKSAKDISAWSVNLIASASEGIADINLSAAFNATTGQCELVATQAVPFAIPLESAASPAAEAPVVEAAAPVVEANVLDDASCITQAHCEGLGHRFTAGFDMMGGQCAAKESLGYMTFAEECSANTNLDVQTDTLTRAHCDGLTQANSGFSNARRVSWNAGTETCELTIVQTSEVISLN